MEDVRNKLFWHRCDALLEEKRTNPNAVSEFSFMSRNAYRNARAKQSAPGIDFVDGMARMFDVSVEWLIAGTRKGEPYIPKEVPQPESPDTIVRDAKRLASHLMYPSAVALVLSQSPDPRMGVARLVELFYRADTMLAVREKTAAKRKRKTKRAPHASR